MVQDIALGLLFTPTSLSILDIKVQSVLRMPLTNMFNDISASLGFYIFMGKYSSSMDWVLFKLWIVHTLSLANTRLIRR